MKDQIIALRKVLTKYNEIQYIASLTQQLDFLLGQKNLTFSQVSEVFSKYPFVGLISHFSAFDTNDLHLLKNTVIELIDAAADAWARRFEKWTAKQLVLYYLFLVQDDEGIGEIYSDDEADFDKSELLRDFSGLPKVLLIVGAEKLAPNFLYLLNFDDKIHHPFIHPTEVKKNKEAKLQLANLAMFWTHFVELPLDQLIDTYHRRFDCIAVRTDCSIQYNLGDSFYYELSPPAGTKSGDQKNTWDFKKIKFETSSPKLLSVNITNCHTVLIFEAHKNRFWLLHVSPSSVSGVQYFGGLTPKKAYIDLQKHYQDNAIGVDENAELEICVIEARDGFDAHFNQRLLEERLPTNKVTITKISTSFLVPRGITLASEEKQHEYNLCYDVINNSLMLKQGDNVESFTDVFKFHPAYKNKGIGKDNSKAEVLSEFGMFAPSKSSEPLIKIKTEEPKNNTTKNCNVM